MQLDCCAQLDTLSDHLGSTVLSQSSLSVRLNPLPHTLVQQTLLSSNHAQDPANIPQPPRRTVTPPNPVMQQTSDTGSLAYLCRPDQPLQCQSRPGSASQAPLQHLPPNSTTPPTPAVPPQHPASTSAQAESQLASSTLLTGPAREAVLDAGAVVPSLRFQRWVMGKGLSVNSIQILLYP